MAVLNREKQPNKPSLANSEQLQPSKIKLILKEGALIGWLFVCIYLLIALATHSSEDPGWSHAGNAGYVLNAGGSLGAWLSDVFFSLLGCVAYLLPMLLALKAWNVFRTHRDNKSGFDSLVFILRILGLTMVLVSATALAALHYGSLETSLPFGVGGILGSSIEVAATAAFNSIGSTLILVAIFLFGMTVFTDISWLALIEWIASGVLRLSEYVSRRIATLKAKRSERIQAMLAQQHRKEVKETRAERDVTRRPLSIQQPSRKPASSNRVEKEKQTSFFIDKNLATLPALGLLDKADNNTGKAFSKDSLQAMSKQLELKLQDFGISAEVIEVLPGPVVTCFEIQPAAGIKASRISGLSRDLARSLAVVSVRVVEVIPGKSYVGIEIPNEHREMVRLSEVLSSEVYEQAKSPLTLALGNDISGLPVCADLAKMPHLLVAGTTGSGKSVGINSMLLSLLYKSTPEDVRLILIDPKMLELSVYDGIPHLLTPVVTDMKDAASSLRWCVGEMERRYKLMSALGVRNLAGYNKKIMDSIAAGSPLVDPLWKPDEFFNEEDSSSPPSLDKLPCIVVVIDEFADMMMIVGKKVEQLIARIAQKARAAGIHLILATQRPSVDVITGLIKANVPSRIAFQVSSKIDSRTILDQSGAESLLGHGDLLYLPPGTSIPIRVHGAFVDDHEVHKVVADWKSRGVPEYLEDITSEAITSNIPVPGYGDDGGGGDQESDPLYDEAVSFVIQTRKASISSVQRKLRVGYNRAARLVEQMEASGVVSEMGSNGNRDVLAPDNSGD
ncbi:MAG: DNA translocase FtsK 4TM domain-containing protein [Porticoccus sp.]|jgi:S-DNA-T family DNA segregation ATPase FtsK/SpoIIIE|tara:strand:+ start:2468 stop:4831 length:2364 start_codon:yes stop_codon:yes gene_type:complete